VPTTSLLTTQKSSCRSRFLRVPMAMQYRRPKHLPGHMLHDYYHRLLGYEPAVGDDVREVHDGGEILGASFNSQV
jgi:hypothetical protein